MRNFELSDLPPKLREQAKAQLSPRQHRQYQGWHTIGGKRCYFHSHWEVNYACYLEWLKQKGEIREWEYEPHTFWFDDIKRGVRSYLPDFRVTESDGSVVYHEIKGYMDSRSKTKIKRMAKYYPEVKLVVIDKEAYREIEKAAKQLVPGWV